MKRLVFLLMTIPSLAFAGGVCGSGILRDINHNGRPDYVCVETGASIYSATATASFPYGATASSLTITNNTSTMTATFTTLPINGGFGPQVSDPRWLMISNVDGTTAATFTLRSSTYNNTDYHHLYGPEIQMAPSTILGAGSISFALGPAGEVPVSISSQGFTIQGSSLTVDAIVAASGTVTVFTTKAITLASAAVSIAGVVGTTVTISAGANSAGKVGASFVLGPGGRGSNGGQNTTLTGSDGIGDLGGGNATGDIAIQTRNGLFGNPGSIFLTAGESTGGLGNGGRVRLKAGMSRVTSYPPGNVYLEGGDSDAMFIRSGGVGLEVGANQFGDGIGEISISTTQKATARFGGTIYGVQDASVTTKLNVPIITSTTSITVATLTATGPVTVSSVTLSGSGFNLKSGARIYFSNPCGDDQVYLENNGIGDMVFHANCGSTFQFAGDLVDIIGAVRAESYSGDIIPASVLASDVGSTAMPWRNIISTTVTTSSITATSISASSATFTSSVTASNFLLSATPYTNGQMLFGVTATGGLSVSTMSGTTNQVTVTASSFNVTLSLPQSINTSATPQFGQMGLGTPGGTAQRLKIVAGSVNQCAINIAPGTLKTTPVAGDIDNATDDIYYTIQTGAARKNFVLSDSALTTGGHVPYTSTNGRLVDTSFFTFVGNRLAISAGSSGGAISISAGGRPNPAVAGDIWIDTTTTKVRAIVDSSTDTFVMAEATQTFTGTINVSSINVISSGKLFSGGALVGLVVSTYSDSGTFNFGTTTNTIAIANSSSTITLTSSGTYRIDGMANMRYNGATFAANQFVTLNLYRQNNTPGVITNSQSQEETQISVSGLTSQFGQFNLPPIFYTTTNTTDIISLHGSISATPGAGNFQATEASLVAQRLY